MVFRISLVIVIVTLVTGGARALGFENSLFQLGSDAGGEAMSNSVRSMLEEGFSQNEIVETIKTKLGAKRINAYIEKMYDGEELSEEEIATMKSGEVEDSDEELMDLLDEFHQLIESQNGNSSHVNNSRNEELGNDTELVKELFLDNEEYSVPRDASQNGQLPKPNYAYSPYDLIKLVKTEEAIYKPLKKYMRRIEAKLEALRRYSTIGIHHEITSE